MAKLGGVVALEGTGGAAVVSKVLGTVAVVRAAIVGRAGLLLDTVTTLGGLEVVAGMLAKVGVEEVAVVAGVVGMLVRVGAAAVASAAVVVVAEAPCRDGVESLEGGAKVGRVMTLVVV